MEPTTPKKRLTFLRQSSLAPAGRKPAGHSTEESEEHLTPEHLDATLQLLFYAAKGNVGEVEQMLSKDVDIDSVDFDQRTALHVAACENQIAVVNSLVKRGANVNAQDRWGSTPLADAQHYGNMEICHILEQHGGHLAKNARNSLMRIASSLVPEYEIDQSKLNFDVPPVSKKGDLHRAAIWQGTRVWVKFLPGTSIAANDRLLRKFKDELALLLKLRHPHVVQFLGAVTQTSPMMIVTEFLPGGSLKTFMEKNRRIESAKVLVFALDVARGLNYLHEHKPVSITHRDLKPSNLLLADPAGHVKVANFGLDESIREEDGIPEKSRGTSLRYMAPELFNHGECSTSVDTFAFGLILWEMLQGHPPFPEMEEDVDVARAYADNKRPPFKHGGRHYPPHVKELIEECWDKDPFNRPQFGQVIQRLELMSGSTSWRSKLKSLLTR